MHAGMQAWSIHPSASQLACKGACLHARRYLSVWASLGVLLKRPYGSKHAAGAGAAAQPWYT